MSFCLIESDDKKWTLKDVLQISVYRFPMKITHLTAFMKRETADFSRDFFFVTQMQWCADKSNWLSGNTGLIFPCCTQPY